MPFEKVIVIDGRGHLMGRLAATVAKELLEGQKVVVTRCDEINISGSIYRNKIKYQLFVRKRTNTNPKKGPIHFSTPAKMFWRVVRGMLPHKIQKGKAALSRFKCFEGIPSPYDKMKRVVVPDALRALRLRSIRQYTVLGELAQQVGWTRKDLLETLETKRKVKSDAFHKVKKARKSLKAKAIAEAQKEISKESQETLAKFGY